MSPKEQGAEPDAVAEKPGEAEQSTADSKEQKESPRDDGEAFGAEQLSGELLDRAAERAASSRALDQASRAFDQRTNQQINNFYGAGPRRTPIETVPLSPDTLDRVRRDFVRPAEYEALWEVVERRHLVVLSAPAGFGRTHTSRHVLDAVCESQVVEITGGSLVDLDEADLAEDTGYLWTGMCRPHVGRVETHLVERLSELLRVRHARMIILAVPEIEWPFELHQHRFELAVPPDIGEICRRQIAGHGATAEEVADLLVRPVVARAASRLAGAGAAARLGTALRQVLTAELTPEEAVGRAEEDTANWLYGLRDGEERAVALALGALNGLSFPAVVAGARQLDELIQCSEDSKAGVRLPPFRRPTPQLLAAVDAEICRGEAELSYGRVPISCLRSTRPQFGVQMLSALWTGFPYLQEIYLRWLEGLVEADDQFVREQAAVATGVLATEDFDFVRERVLLPWAGSDRPRIQRAAGVALRIPALHSELSDTAWRILDEWAAAKDRETFEDQNCRKTAIVALGGPIGATDVGRALDMITDRLLEYRSDRNQYHHWALTGGAVADLFGDGGTLSSRQVLDRMASWLRGGGRGSVNVALAALIGIAGRPPVAEAQKERRLPPIVRASADLFNRELIAKIWRAALNHRVNGEIALLALRRLISLGAESDDAGAWTAELVGAIPESARDYRTLIYFLPRWADEEAHPEFFALVHDRLRGTEVA